MQERVEMSRSIMRKLYRKNVELEKVRARGCGADLRQLPDQSRARVALPLFSPP